MMPVLFINSRGVPYVDLIGRRQKTLETRSKDMLRSLSDSWILIAETGSGTPVVKALAFLGQGFPVRSRKEWDRLRPAHLVPEGSRYDWSASTVVKWLYSVSCAVQLPHPFTLPADSVRHGRTWAELDTDNLDLLLQNA